MYAVSQAFLDAIRAQKRQVVARVAIDYTDPSIDQSINVETNEQARISWPAQTADGLAQAPYLWASLDGTWLAGDRRRPMPDTKDFADRFQVGWWGYQLADGGGSFAAPHPTLTVTHIPRPVHALRVTGDELRREYPVSFTVRLRDKDNILLHEETVTGNSQAAWSKKLDAPVIDVATQEIEIHQWSHEGRQAKILEFFSSIQQVYEENLIGISLLEERETSQGSLPVGNISSNELVVRLSNEDKRFDPDNTASPLYGLIKPNRRIRAWLGVESAEEIEWVPLGTFWALDWDIRDDLIEAHVRARDRLELLRKSTYQPGAVRQNVSLHALADEILRDAGLGTDEYVIDDALKDMIIPWAWMEPMTHREALRIVAEAAIATVYCGRDNKIHIALPKSTERPAGDTYYIQGAPYAAEIDGGWWYGIGPDDYFLPLRTPSRQDEVANNIVVVTQPLRPAATSKEVYRSNTPISIDPDQTVTVTIKYMQPPVIDAVASLPSPPANVAITDVTYVAWGAEVAIRNRGTEVADVDLIVTGKPLSIQGGEQIIIRDDQSITENGPLRYEFPANPLVQTLRQARDIATGLLTSVKIARRDVEMEWRGNPALELGDPVVVVTDAKQERRSEYTIIRQEMEWLGALSARLTGRRLT